MNVDKKKTMQVETEYKRLKKIIENAISNGNYEKALAGISVASYLMYEWNQKATDDYLETAISSVAIITRQSKLRMVYPQEDVVMFYDGFGLDTRGLAYIYLRALVNHREKLVYVVPKAAKNKQQEIDKIFVGKNVRIIYYSTQKHYCKLLELQKIYMEVRPAKAFIYTTPCDSSGVALFMQMENVIRYQINLTDHAFWLGTHAFDYCLEYRNYGASISYYHRNIAKEKLIMIPIYPVIDLNKRFDGFPFETLGKKILFSGGSLYKTIDSDNTYFYMVDQILHRNEDLIFVYAGGGYSGELNRLMKKYPRRAYHIHERSDLYQAMVASTLYLNTYPLPGGLMTQYAAVAGKIPITLRYDVSGEGYLLDQENRGCIYDSKEDLIEDVTKLLKNSEYLRQREEKIKGSVIKQIEFDTQIDKILNSQASQFRIEYKAYNIDTFKRGFIERFDYNEFLISIANRSNSSLACEYMNAYVRKLVVRGCKKIVQVTHTKFFS